MKLISLVPNTNLPEGLWFMRTWFCHERKRKKKQRKKRERRIKD